MPKGFRRHPRVALQVAGRSPSALPGGPPQYGQNDPLEQWPSRSDKDAWAYSPPTLITALMYLPLLHCRDPPPLTPVRVSSRIGRHWCSQYWCHYHGCVEGAGRGRRRNKTRGKTHGHKPRATLRSSPVNCREERGRIDVAAPQPLLSRHMTRPSAFFHQACQALFRATYHSLPPLACVLKI